jgi:general stress protein 26
MENSENIQAQIRGLFNSQKLAVLSTQSNAQPYSSLVAFLGAEDLKCLYFVTPKTTRKFANLSDNRRVAVLINSSTNRAADFHRAIAVTATGEAEEPSAADREKILPLYLAKHPYLEEFAKSPTCALVRVTVRTYYLVRNFQHVMEYHLIP